MKKKIPIHAFNLPTIDQTSCLVAEQSAIVEPSRWIIDFSHWSIHSHKHPDQITYPHFNQELIKNGLRCLDEEWPELYKYHGKREILNEAVDKKQSITQTLRASLSSLLRQKWNQTIYIQTYWLNWMRYKTHYNTHNKYILTRSVTKLQ